MIRRYRRYWSLTTILLLALPLVVGIVRPDTETRSSDELRDVAKAPQLPDSIVGWRQLPAQIDAYLHDHFGLRKLLIHWEAFLNQGILQSGNASVLFGHDGRMFFKHDSMVRQSAGLVRRDNLVAATADFLAAMKLKLSARGIAFLVASPPNSVSVYEAQLPDWARNHDRRTEYDLLLDELAARGVLAVDPRPARRDALAGGKVYRVHDTHWTPRGALTAFNVVAEAGSHSDWRLNIGSVLDKPIDVNGGELSRLLGIVDVVSEPVEPLTLLHGRHEVLSAGSPPTFLETNDRPGPTIVIIGDSFTDSYFPPMLLRNAGRVVWLFHYWCAFDWKWIDQFHPDEVWWMPTERYLICQKELGRTFLRSDNSLE
jgi:alginate O-acetyltransferase complex protein AlgJ